MNKHLLLILLGFGLIGCSSDNDEIRLTCTCLYNFEDNYKSSCRTNTFVPFLENLSLLIYENDKSFIFNGHKYDSYHDSFSTCTEVIDDVIYSETENCEEAQHHHYGKFLTFDNRLISYFRLDSLFGAEMIEFDRTSLVYRTQIIPSNYVFPDGSFKPRVNEPLSIRPDLNSYQHFQCKIVNGI